MKHLLQTNTIIPAISGCRGKLSGGKKGAAHCRCAEELWFVCRCGISTGDPTLSNAATFLTVLEKWAVRLCNQKKKKKTY